MSATYDYLQKCKSALIATNVFTSVAVGLERGIGAKDAPFARIVPISHKPSGVGTALRFQVVFGFDTKNKDYEILHSQYFDTEESIVKAIQRTGAKWENTVTDEDAVLNLKTAVIIFTNEDIQCS